MDRYGCRKDEVGKERNEAANLQVKAAENRMIRILLQLRQKDMKSRK